MIIRKRYLCQVNKSLQMQNILTSVIPTGSHVFKSELEIEPYAYQINDSIGHKIDGSTGRTNITS